MKRMTSPIRRPSKNHEETLATTQSCDDHTLNTTSSQSPSSLQKLLRTKTQDTISSSTNNNTKIRRAMSRTVTCPGLPIGNNFQDNQNLVSYISPPLGDFRHTAHLGHHGESFGDLSFLNSTKIEYSDKNAGLRLGGEGVAGEEIEKVLDS